MKNLNTAILIALGMALPLSVMASPDDDVTIRMMEANEQAVESVTTHIELPEAADDHARDHAAKGLDMANNEKSDERDHEMDNKEDRDHEMDKERGDEHERDMDREDERERDMDREDERDMESERDDRKDVEHDGMDREEVEREGLDNIDHRGDNRSDNFEAPDLAIDAVEVDVDVSTH